MCIRDSPSGAASARGAWKGPGLAGDSWPRWVLPIWNTLCVLLTFRFQVPPLLLTFRFQLVPVLLTFRYQVTAEAMALISPKELVPGVTRGQILQGRVCVLNRGVNNKGHDFVTFHLVVEPGLSGLLYIEAWRDHARRVLTVAADHRILELRNVTVKSLGDKAKWQCSDLEVFGMVLNGTTLNAVEGDDADRPLHMPFVQINDLPKFRRTSHLITISAILMEATPVRSNKPNAPDANLLLAAGHSSVRVGDWKDHTDNINTKDNEGKAVILYNIKVAQGQDDTTDLNTTKNSKLEKAPPQLSDDCLLYTSDAADE